MESHAVSARLHDSRERMRSLLIPDAATGRIESGVFPRSAVMQFLFNARARRLALTLVSLVLMLRGRRRAQSFWPQLTQSLGGLIGLPRHY
jgi:hypothetical protein